jgi:plastocyanin
VIRLDRLARVALMLCAVVGVTAETPRTASVEGTLTLLERPGGERNDLGTAIVYLESTDERASDARDARDADGNDATIVMRGREFIPRAAVVRTGGAVKFPNGDPFSHNVFSNTEQASFDLGLYRRGSTRSASFQRPGVYPIYCNIHARMVSYVIAVPGRHVTTPASDGKFVLADVPVGSYRLHVWHERARLVSEPVEVTGAGATLRIALDARGYVPGVHLNKFGVPYSPTRSDRY